MIWFRPDFGHAVHLCPLHLDLTNVRPHPCKIWFLLQKPKRQPLIQPSDQSLSPLCQRSFCDLPLTACLDKEWVHKQDNLLAGRTPQNLSTASWALSSIFRFANLHALRNPNSHMHLVLQTHKHFPVAFLEPRNVSGQHHPTLFSCAESMCEEESSNTAHQTPKRHKVEHFLWGDVLSQYMGQKAFKCWIDGSDKRVSAVEPPPKMHQGQIQT